MFSLVYFAADFMRPVVIMGPIADLARMMLIDEMPDRFGNPCKKQFIFYSIAYSIVPKLYSIHTYII